MQLVGTEFASTSANLGNDISTFPDFPAEIRAPVGTLAGVSGFQVQFSSTEIYTPGDRLNALVAMNPAALKTRLKDLEPGGILIVNKDAFGAGDLRKAGYVSNPLEDGSLAGYRVISVPLTTLNREAVAERRSSARARPTAARTSSRSAWSTGSTNGRWSRRCKWIAREVRQEAAVMLRQLAPPSRPATTTAKPPSCCRSTTTSPRPCCRRAAIARSPATKRWPSAWSPPPSRPTRRCSTPAIPITPASDILHHLVGMKHFGVSCIQAEDEIAAVGMAIGAAFGGCLGVTATSGPGICLKSEAIGLAVMTELPVVVIDVQRGGPSTGLPTKTEQADLLAGDVRPQRRMSRRRSSRPARRATASRWRSRRCGWRSAT